MEKALIIILILMSLNLLSACRGREDNNEKQESLAPVAPLEIENADKPEHDRVLDEQSNIDKKTNMQISIQAGDKELIFELNNSPAAKELYQQLPLTIAVEDYSDNEKIFYPPEKLNTDNTPLANAQSGTLAYYEPWGDVVMFYDDFGSASGLYELGKVISGSEHIRNLSGTITINKVK